MAGWTVLSFAANDFIQVNCRPFILFFLHIRHKNVGRSAFYGTWASNMAKAGTCDSLEAAPAHVIEAMLYWNMNFANLWSSDKHRKSTYGLF